MFAQVIGTIELLQPEERKRIAGIVINKFRGDVALFADWGQDDRGAELGSQFWGSFPSFETLSLTRKTVWSWVDLNRNPLSLKKSISPSCCFRI